MNTTSRDELRKEWERQQLDEADALMDSLVIEDEDHVTLWPEGEDPLTKARELLKEASKAIRQDAKMYEVFTRYKRLDLVTRIEHFLEGKE